MTTLKSLIVSERSPEQLSRAERKLLSRWAAKTAFMIDLGGLESHVPLAHARALYENADSLPPHVYVFVRQQPRTRPWYFIAGATWQHAGLTHAAAARVQQESYKIAVQFGDLCLFVIYWPLRAWGIRVEKQQLVKLWPPTAIVKEYRHPVPFDVTASDEICQRLITTISVVPNRGAEGFSRRGA